MIGARLRGHRALINEVASWLTGVAARGYREPEFA